METRGCVFPCHYAVFKVPKKRGRGAAEWAASRPRELFISTSEDRVKVYRVAIEDPMRSHGREHKHTINAATMKLRLIRDGLCPRLSALFKVLRGLVKQLYRALLTLSICVC